MKFEKYVLWRSVSHKDLASHSIFIRLTRRTAVALLFSPATVLRFRGHEFQGTTTLVLRDLETGGERVLVTEVNRYLTQINAQYSYREFPGFTWSSDSGSIIAAYGMWVSITRPAR